VIIVIDSTQVQVSPPSGRHQKTTHHSPVHHLSAHCQKCSGRRLASARADSQRAWNTLTRPERLRLRGFDTPGHDSIDFSAYPHLLCTVPTGLFICTSGLPCIRGICAQRVVISYSRIEDTDVDRSQPGRRCDHEWGMRWLGLTTTKVPSFKCSACNVGKIRAGRTARRRSCVPC
jgi:hypothetical protein